MTALIQIAKIFKPAMVIVFFAMATMSVSVISAKAVPVTVNASVSGDINDIVTFTEIVDPATGKIIDAIGDPIPLDALSFLTYGDFTVNGGNDLGASTTTVGDGINDETWWVFDFTGDANFAAFTASTDPLISAILTLRLIPRVSEVSPDGAFVPGLNGVYDVSVIGPLGDPVDIILQLIQPDLVALGKAHDAADILAQFGNSGSFGPSNSLDHGAGQLPFKYFDDSHVLSASLELTRDVALPEPGPLALLGLGLLGLGIARKRHRANRIK